MGMTEDHTKRHEALDNLDYQENAEPIHTDVMSPPQLMNYSMKGARKQLRQRRLQLFIKLNMPQLRLASSISPWVLKLQQ